MAKVSNGIIGITRNNTARDKFCITWAERSFVSHFVSRNGKRSAHNIYTRKDAFPSHQELKVMKNSSHGLTFSGLS